METTKVSPFRTNYKYNLQVYQQLRVDLTKVKKAIVLVDKLITFYKQIIININFRNQRIVHYINKKQS